MKILCGSVHRVIGNDSDFVHVLRARWIQSFVLRKLRRIDVRRRRQHRLFRHAVGKALGVFGVGGDPDRVALFEHRLGAPEVDVGGGQEGDAAVPVLVVVPGEQRTPPRQRVFEGGEAPGIARVVLQGLPLCQDRCRL